ncbi:lanthionine synthetase C family protein [Nocardiopsis lambiniae]|uniref:Lanthionine synthetase C family protein n=1 Tax=Nocardiopsis lambiniae TaxID=3075539 RepID=A0ABU2MDB2_9ACTN|nr:lanthionine synthetase C family protein [Nocardiopsis sp. DSM 44743]MDT0330110.1 lanthionine synthetase C family protein [Nocardiopsis sp. DSM 44743]
MSTPSTTGKATAVATHVADLLATPEHGRAWAGGRWWPQSLAQGAAGVALLHIERARTGDGPWERAQAWLECAVAQGVDASPTAHLHYGAPALAFVLNRAQSVRSRFGPQLTLLDEAVNRIVTDRLERAHERLAAGELPVLAEFDTIRGLTGLGALLLARDAQNPRLREMASYLVALTEPLVEKGSRVPGWWTAVGLDGKEDPRFPGGHANTGVAHGISGPLSLLALTLGRGIAVEGHAEAIGRILVWLETWQQNGADGVWWPYWITKGQFEGIEHIVGPRRPSWCYGAVGVAHAQLAGALALRDEARTKRIRRVLDREFAAAPTSPLMRDASLCHGYAGLALSAHSTGVGHVEELLSPVLAEDDPRTIAMGLITGGGIGLLEGAAGTALALHTLTCSATEVGWAGFLLCGDSEDDRG